MNQGDWIVVPNWKRFQHYGLIKTPAWIKLYTSLNSHDAWNGLSMAERGLLVTIWIEYARSGGRLKTARIPTEDGYKYLRRHLESLNHAGFIHFSSRAEVEVEEKEVVEGPKEQNPAYPNVPQSPRRQNARAYRPANTPPPTTVDLTMLAMARDWSSRHRESSNNRGPA